MLEHALQHFSIFAKLTSGVLEHKWRVSLKTILFLLTSNTEATENKVQFLNLAYRVKGFQCHSNNSLQLLELKEKTTTTKQYTLGPIKIISCLSSENFKKLERVGGFFFFFF